MEVPELIEKLADKLGTTSTLIVSEYTGWFIADSLVSVVFSAVVIFFAWKWKPSRDKDDDAISFGLKHFARAALLIGFGITITCNVPSLVQPKAKAIHQLLNDVRGR